jgi:hypothetical protein
VNAGLSAASKKLLNAMPSPDVGSIAKENKSKRIVAHTPLAAMAVRINRRRPPAVTGVA